MAYYRKLFELSTGDSATIGPPLPLPATYIWLGENGEQNFVLCGMMELYKLVCAGSELR